MEKVILNFLSFYIKSSIHVAFAVVSLALISFKMAHYKPSLPLLIFIFCSALFSYNFIKFFHIIWENKNDNFYNPIFWLSFICLIISLYLFFNFPILTKIILVMGGVLVLFYTLPVNNNLNNLRNAKGWKVYLVVVSWILLTVGVPLASNSVFEKKLFLQLSIIQGIYIFVAILPFDIRDLNSDSKNLNTLPQQLGISRVKVLGYILLFLNFIFTIICFGFQSPITISEFISFSFLAFLLKKSHPNNSKYFSSFWVEAIPIFWVGFFYLII
tara:strand:- start:340 stop:1152 length:813 start_codon:yes stop_codon:yes gene_type:complete